MLPTDLHALSVFLCPWPVLALTVPFLSMDAAFPALQVFARIHSALPQLNLFAMLSPKGELELHLAIGHNREWLIIDSVKDFES